MHTVAESGTRSRVAANRSARLDCPACGCHQATLYLHSRDYFFLRRSTYELSRCPDCHLCWLTDPPRPQDLALHYGNDYDKAIKVPGDLYPNHWDAVRNKVLKYVQGGSILDIGCSSGSFLRSMKSPDWKLYGIEMSNLVAQQARETAGAEVFVGDVMGASYPPSTFDVVTGFHVLEHMHDPRRVMASVLGWLKPA